MLIQNDIVCYHAVKNDTNTRWKHLATSIFPKHIARFLIQLVDGPRKKNPTYIVNTEAFSLFFKHFKISFLVFHGGYYNFKDL